MAMIGSGSKGMDKDQVCNVICEGIKVSENKLGELEDEIAGLPPGSDREMLEELADIERDTVRKKRELAARRPCNCP